MPRRRLGALRRTPCFSSRRRDGRAGIGAVRSDASRCRKRRHRLRGFAGKQCAVGRLRKFLIEPSKRSQGLRFEAVTEMSRPHRPQLDGHAIHSQPRYGAGAPDLWQARSGAARNSNAMAGGMGKPRKSGEPNAAVVRKIGILLDLVRNKRISMSGCRQAYGASERTLLRDLQELRDIGATAGFRIGDRVDGDYFEMSEFKARPAGLLGGEKRLRSLIAELFKAFGEPVHDVAEGLADPAAPSGGQGFLHLVQPQLADGSAVSKVYRALEAAWQNDARVEFRYRGQSRTVEPGAAVVRAGRYYLVGRDVAKGRNGWRNFSMDLIGAPIRRCGTFKRVAPPAKYLSADTIGFFKGDGPERTVEVTLSKTVAPSATSRVWQEAQRVLKNSDGSVTIAFRVDDIDEVVRWAFGYGDEAWVDAPPAAVERARATLANMRRHYD